MREKLFAFEITHNLNEPHERIEHLCLKAESINCDIHPIMRLILHLIKLIRIPLESLRSCLHSLYIYTYFHKAAVRACDYQVASMNVGRSITQKLGTDRYKYTSAI